MDTRKNEVCNTDTSDSLWDVNDPIEQVFYGATQPYAIDLFKVVLSPELTLDARNSFLAKKIHECLKIKSYLTLQIEYLEQLEGKLNIVKKTKNFASLNTEKDSYRKFSREKIEEREQLRLQQELYNFGLPVVLNVDTKKSLKALSQKKEDLQNKLNKNQGTVDLLWKKLEDLKNFHSERYIFVKGHALFFLPFLGISQENFAQISVMLRDINLSAGYVMDNNIAQSEIVFEFINSLLNANLSTDLTHPDTGDTLLHVVMRNLVIPSEKSAKSNLIQSLFKSLKNNHAQTELASPIYFVDGNHHVCRSVLYLLEQGASMHIPNDEGLTIGQELAKMSNLFGAQLLATRGLLYEAMSVASDCPSMLHIAMRKLIAKMMQPELFAAESLEKEVPNLKQSSAFFAPTFVDLNHPAYQFAIYLLDEGILKNEGASHGVIYTEHEINVENSLCLATLLSESGENLYEEIISTRNTLAALLLAMRGLLDMKQDNHEGNTFAHIAALNGDFRLMRHILTTRYGRIKLFAHNKAGQTPWDILMSQDEQYKGKNRADFEKVVAIITDLVFSKLSEEIKKENETKEEGEKEKGKEKGKEFEKEEAEWQGLTSGSGFQKDVLKALMIQDNILSKQEKYNILWRWLKRLNRKIISEQKKMVKQSQLAIVHSMVHQDDQILLDLLQSFSVSNADVIKYEGLEDKLKRYCNQAKIESGYALMVKERAQEDEEKRRLLIESERKAEKAERGKAKVEEEKAKVEEEKAKIEEEKAEEARLRKEAEEKLSKKEAEIEELRKLLESSSAGKVNAATPVSSGHSLFLRPVQQTVHGNGVSQEAQENTMSLLSDQGESPNENKTATFC